MKKSITNRAVNIILVLIFFVGLSLLLYPTLSDYWNSCHQTAAIEEYTQEVAALDEETYEQIWNLAVEYNEELADRGLNYHLTDAQILRYEQMLDVSGTGVMGYVEIPQIRCSLPIYHGTEDAVLQTAIGHLEWSSLPVGGEDSHCVLSGHRGLPSAKLFSNLDQLREGDIFMLHVLDETLTYEVDQIRIVLPHELDELEIEEGQDYCTLVTCTPYGVNSHRLLVRGHRIENPDGAGEIQVTADALQIEPVIVAPVVAVPILLVLLVILLCSDRQKKRNKR